MSRAAFVVALLLVLSTAASRADDNLLGLPPPNDPLRPGSVVLHGGGAITGDVFNRFIELAGGRDASIILVPCAGYRVGDYDTEREFLNTVGSRYASWPDLQRTGRIRKFRFLYTDDPGDADDPGFVKALESATGVWFSGGSQLRLNYRFVGHYPEQTRFQAALRSVLARGGVVGGTSAGMAALPEVMTLWEEREYEGAPANAIAAHGLGVFNRAIVEQHFDARGGRLERFTGLLRDSAQLEKLTGRLRAGERMLGIGVAENTALVVRGNLFEVLGDSSVHVFVKTQGGRTIQWHELAPGDTAQLKRDVANIGLVPEETRLVR